MIIDEKVKDLVVVGEDTSKKATISANKLGKLQYLLTKGLYKDPVTAVIAEWTNNGIDSVVQAGKDPIENPVLVKIQRDDKGQYRFYVEDKGLGLDDKDFEDICMNYLESTKEEDNDTIGHFGIGMKSFLSLERSATFTCRKNGIERKYLVYEGPEFVNYDLIYEKSTEEESGVIAELQINDWSERERFITKAKQKLAYYDTAVLLVDGRVVENDIYRNELFQWSTLNQNGNMHICLKDVYYTIDWEALGIKPLPISIALRFNLGDGLKPTPSRESYITNDKTTALILDRIKKVAEWFVKRYNDTVKEFETFLEAYDYIGETTFRVSLNDKTTFVINHLVPYSTTKLLNPKVKGITIRNPNDYKVRKSSLLFEWTPVGYTNDRGMLKTKPGRMGTSKEHHIFNGHKTVEVGDNFKGNIKEFLKQKYGNGIMYIRRNTNVRRLGTTKDNQGYEAYRYVLDLTTKPKSVWRSHIDEWNFVSASVSASFINEKDVETTKEFEDWLEKKREAQKIQRAKNSKGSKHIGLGKQLGDVTLAYSYERYGKVFFRKEAFPIASLHKNQYLTVLATESDNIELVKEVAQLLKQTRTIRFALVGKKEIRKVPKHFQFINFQQFMSRDCKPFMRMASAIKFRELLNDYDKVANYKHTVFSEILKTFNSNVLKLRDFSSKHMVYGLYGHLSNIIIDVADEYNLYDKTLWPEYLMVKEALRKYDFISLISVPQDTNHELTKRYETLVNQILLFRKKYYNDLPDGAKIVFEPVEDKTKENEVV